MMKKQTILLLIAILFIQQLIAQKITINYIESRLVTHQGVEFLGKLKDKNNDIYSFPNWDNQGVLFIDNHKYYLSNLNFNVATNSFESRIKRDELFSYKTSQIDSVAINNHLFKKVGNSFYEVLFEKDNNLFLKKYAVKYKAGSVNRLNGTQGKATTSLTFKYLVKSKDIIKPVELSKNGFLSIFNQDQQEIVDKYVKSEKLSYKKEKDMIEIIEFMISTSGKII